VQTVVYKCVTNLSVHKLSLMVQFSCKTNVPNFKSHYISFKRKECNFSALTHGKTWNGIFFSKSCKHSWLTGKLCAYASLYTIIILVC
jgi:hypothetical protein